MCDQLKTMGINALLEEIALSESVQALAKIEKLAKVELTDAHPDTAKAVERLISYKMRLHTKRLLPYVDKPNPKQLEGFASLKKLMFYDYASVFFTGYGFNAVVQVLEEAARDTPALRQKANDALTTIMGLDHYWRDVISNN